VLPLYRQPMFVNQAFGPYSGAISSRPELSPATIFLPACERICSSEGAWFGQNLLLGSAADMNDIAAAIQKVYDHRSMLQETHCAGAAP
jgi:hypothetical protein